METQQKENPSIEISRLDTRFQYYGLPMAAGLGWLYRYDDFSIFPNVGIKFDVDKEPKMQMSAGFTVYKGIFLWSANVYYNLLPFTMTKPLEDQKVFFKISFQ